MDAPTLLLVLHQLFDTIKSGWDCCLHKSHIVDTPTLPNHEWIPLPFPTLNGYPYPSEPLVIVIVSQMHIWHFLYVSVSSWGGVYGSTVLGEA